jgi:hypothetical protein
LSEQSDDANFQAIRTEELTVYIVVMLLMIAGISVLLAYAISLGSLVGPGVEQSFGIAVALMFLMSAVVFHILDKTYRGWPLGRKVHPTPPGPVTEKSQLLFVKWLIVAIAAAGIIYLFGSLLGAW